MELHSSQYLILTGENKDDFKKEGKILICLILEEHVKRWTFSKIHSVKHVKMYISNYKTLPTLHSLLDDIKTKITYINL